MDMKQEAIKERRGWERRGRFGRRVMYEVSNLGRDPKVMEVVEVADEAGERFGQVERVEWRGRGSRK